MQRARSGGSGSDVGRADAGRLAAGRSGLTRALAGGGTVALLAVLAGACGEGDLPRGGAPIVDPVGGGGAPALASGPCDDGAVRTCKIQLDEDNCFVGEQRCDGGTWGACLESDGLETAALGSQSDCASNPCNPWCQHYGEDPEPDLEATGTAPPPGGNAAGLPSAWTKRGLDDNVYGNQPCTEANDCQFDHFCDTSTGACTAWGEGQFDPNAGGIDITVPVVCSAGEITVCNRGSVQAPAGIEIGVMDAAAPDFQKCQSFTGSIHDRCTTSVPIDPGQCITVNDCSWNGTKTVYANLPTPPGTPPGPLAESSSQAGDACANNWSVYHTSAQCSCSSQTVSQSLPPVNMFYVLDNSRSMFTSGIWDDARDATIAFLEDPGSDFLNVTLRTYGDDPVVGCNNSACSVDACAVPVAPLDSLQNAAHQQTLVDFVSNVGDELGTPHIASLGGACKWATEYSAANPGGQEVVVYVSDGGKQGSCIYNGNASTRNQIAKKASDALASQGVLTYAVALPGADTTLLNAIANAGGTTMINLTGSSNLNADLTAALQGIRSALITCDIPIPNAGQVDPNQIDVDYLPNGMTPATPLTQVTNAAACSGASDEFFLDDNAAPTEVTLCPSTCNTVQADPNAAIEVVGACIGGYTQYQPAPYTYFGDCSAYAMSGPVWQYFSYDSTVPGDATITFEMRTGNTAAEAATGSWKLVSIATNAQPDVYPSAPINLKNVLGDVDAQRPYLQMRVTLDPTSSGSATPTLYDWDIQFSCLNNE